MKENMNKNIILKHDRDYDDKDCEKDDDKYEKERS